MTTQSPFQQTEQHLPHDIQATINTKTCVVVVTTFRNITTVTVTTTDTGKISEYTLNTNYSQTMVHPTE